MADALLLTVLDGVTPPRPEEGSPSPPRSGETDVDGELVVLIEAFWSGRAGRSVRPSSLHATRANAPTTRQVRLITPVRRTGSEPTQEAASIGFRR